MKRQPSTDVTTARQWEAMTSAVRLEMWEFLRSNGPCSIRELAEQMDRPADGLYHHLRKLVQAGFIAETERRPAGTQVESVYDVTSNDLFFPLNLNSNRSFRWVSKLLQMVIRCAGRTVQAALDTRSESELKGPHRPFSVRWDVGWLDAESLQAVRHHQEAIQSILQQGRTEKRGHLYAVMTYRVPLFRRTSRKP